MKRITKIKLHNFRAFFGNNYQLSMPTGQNVLIYGENGSGKSSVYNALRDFFESSDKPALQFWRNSYADGSGDGSVEVVFSEFPQTNPTTPDEVFNFNTIHALRTADSCGYIKKANKARAFLSYQELVRSYLAPKDDLRNPNLYELIIETLLANHSLVGPNTTGKTIAERWDEIQTGLNKNSARYAAFKVARNSLPGFEQDLLQVLRPILIETNRYLSEFFKNDILIDIDALLVRPHKFPDGKGWWIDKLFRLKVNLFLDDIANGYQHRLNEARLSSIAICLYLAAIKKSPQPDDYKIIFLDDVFIGLDTSNRIPLLELIKIEFPDHQIFISTYDRFWYETALRWFDAQMPNKWKKYEVFVHNAEHSAGKIFDKPIVTDYKDNLSIAQNALKNGIKPDYPAAANYFRKYAEEILTDTSLIPEHHNRNLNPNNDEYGILTKGYELTGIVQNAKHFLQSIFQDTKLIVELESHLKTLLHPLSHFELSTPIYKGELLRIEDCLINLKSFLSEIKVTYKPVGAPLKKMRLNFQVAPGFQRQYAIGTIPVLYVVKLVGGALVFSNCDNFAAHVKDDDNGTISSSVLDYKGDPKYQFSTLADTCQKRFIADTAIARYSATTPIADYIDNFQFMDGTAWHPLRNLLIW